MERQCKSGAYRGKGGKETGDMIGKKCALVKDAIYSLSETQSELL